MAMNGKLNTQMKDIWIYVQHREKTVERETFGLIAEARRIISEYKGNGTVTAIAMGPGLERALEPLGTYGADRVIYAKSKLLNRYQGELFAEALLRMAQKHKPSSILMSQNEETSDLCSRLAAHMESPLVTRAMDFKIDKDGRGVAIRPVANGYLFEKLAIAPQCAPIICFLPSVLSVPEPDGAREAEMVIEPLDIKSYEPKTKILKVIAADPKELDIEDADIVVSGGRGVGKGKSFHIMHELAGILEGTVGGTRPIIDWKILPFERQIGQTGKTVVPRLIFVCGISGANEFTAGIEKSHLIIAINKDPYARIFRFADLGIIGDLHEVVPRLIEGLKKIKKA